MSASIGRRSAKRSEIVDAEGWTHIVTNPAPSQKNNKPKGQRKKETKGHQQDGGHQTSRYDAKRQIAIVQDALAPAEVPDGLTLAQLKETFEVYQRRWKESKAYESLRETLNRCRIRGAGAFQVEKCVCVGLGSPSGLLRGGMVDRRSVSMYQLAALVSILEMLGQLRLHGISALLPSPFTDWPIF